jgi:hypothetical protein
MGMTRTIRFPSTHILSWETISSHLQGIGLTGKIVMIDGLPAFPDEIPEPTWRELRLGFPAGTVTLRRSGAEELVAVVWGNADAALTSTWDRLSWACAAAGGMIETEAGAIGPEAFAELRGLSH